jgi:hypothetical protein
MSRSGLLTDMADRVRTGGRGDVRRTSPATVAMPRLQPELAELAAGFTLPAALFGRGVKNQRAKTTQSGKNSQVIARFSDS